MRVFVAIDIPENIRAEVEPLQNALSIGRRVPVETMHLTLSFLGEQPQQAVEDAHEALSAIRADAFDVQLAGVGTFGKHAPRVVFVHVAPCLKLDDLVRLVTRRLRRAGLEFARQRFRPHVTIARLPKNQSAFDLERVRDFLTLHAAFHGSSFKAESFELYKSTLTPEGAVHEKLASYVLPVVAGRGDGS